jgi:hypothetical protein
MTAYCKTKSSVFASNFSAGPFEVFGDTLSAAIRYLESNPSVKEVTFVERSIYGGSRGEATVTREEIRKRWGV